MSKEDTKFAVSRLFVALLIAGIVLICGLLPALPLIPDNTLTVTVDLSEIETGRIIDYGLLKESSIPKDPYDVFTQRSYDLVTVSLRSWWGGSKLYFMGQQGNQWYATEKRIDSFGWRTMTINTQKMELNDKNQKATIRCASRIGPTVAALLFVVIISLGLIGAIRDDVMHYKKIKEKRRKEELACVGHMIKERQGRR